jgi:hypothetical protein
MERLPAYARRACARAREWALPDMARGIASLGVALLLALAAYLAAGETGLIVGLVVGLAQVIVLFGGGFVVFLVGIVRHPERDPNWQADTHAGGPQNPLNLGLRRMGGPDYIYGNRCTVKHPDGTTLEAMDEREHRVPDTHWKVFEFIYGGQSSNFPSDAHEPVTGRYEVTWYLRLKPDGPWREVVHDRGIAITLPKAAQT